MLSGRYPATTQIFEIGRSLRDTMPDITTMPQHFKNHGYETRSFGKIYHVGIDDDASWTVRAWHSKKPRMSEATKAGVSEYVADAKTKGVEIPQKGQGSRNAAIPAFESVICNDEDLLDGDCATNVIDQLRTHAKNPDQPFFLAVGFANPHVPWISPKKYWDLYDREALPLAKNEFLPHGSPGFAMGEHTWWGAKHNNYEGATRNTLIVATPNQKTAGQTTDALVQSVDLAPTLTELCSLPRNEGFQGRSLKAVLEDPKADVNDAAFSWYPKGGYLGVAMRTKEWRYVEWTKKGQPTERELFDMVADPENNTNLANKEVHAKRVADLNKKLRSRFPVQEFNAPGATPRKTAAQKKSE